jgi:leucine dehydrogenase
MKFYPDLEAAVEDALRLAEGMTYKFAAADFPFGGGKAVLAVPPELAPQARADLLRRYGELIARLGGLFQTGPDVGTSAEDMDIIAETGTPYVFSRTPAAGGSGDPSPWTALGVLTGIQVVCEQVFGAPSPSGRRVLIRGAGHVGAKLAGLLHEAGAEVLVSDINATTARKLSEDLGVEAVQPDAVYDTQCDIFAPCALGGVLNAATIPRLRCQGVAGAANNQLATPSDAETLRRRGILYAPDFIINQGGAVAVSGMESRGWTPEEARRRIEEGIAGGLRGVFGMAEEEGVTTAEAALRIARQRLERG